MVPPPAGEDVAPRQVREEQNPFFLTAGKARTLSLITLQCAAEQCSALRATVRLAVPENCCGLTLFLTVFDRCGNCRLSFSATGSESLQFPRRGKHSGLSGMPAPTYRPGCIPGKSKRGSQAPFGRFNEGGSREGEKPEIFPSLVSFSLVPFFWTSKRKVRPMRREGKTTPPSPGRA